MTNRHQVLDATLKDICSALLESDVNVKLVANLRAKVKAKVKASLDEKTKDANRKNILQKACKHSALLAQLDLRYLYVL
jgi:signal recognition particle subunit SRP54